MSTTQRIIRAHDHSSVLVVDTMGFLKQGAHSMGVARQYSGAAGRPRLIDSFCGPCWPICMRYSKRPSAPKERNANIKILERTDGRA
jgi:hypothetical protein